jgi:hypothetical protein
MEIRAIDAEGFREIVGANLANNDGVAHTCLDDGGYRLKFGRRIERKSA